MSFINEIRTEADPKQKQNNAPKPELVRDDQGHWTLIEKAQEENHLDDKIKQVTNLGQMVMANVVAQSAILLAQAGIKTSRLDAEVLLMSCLGLTKEQLVKKWTEKITEADYTKFQILLARRMKREPLAYIAGNKEFYGMSFMVDNRVMIPRPETETIVDLAIQTIKQGQNVDKSCALVDVGTGCGNIALAIAKNANYIKIYATDLATEALEIAKINARLLKLDQHVAFLHGDLLSPMPYPVNIIVANLPYIPDSVYDKLEPEITAFEPKRCFTAGADGLDAYRKLLAQTPQYLLKGGAMIMEVAPYQLEKLRTIILQYMPSSNIEFPMLLSNPGIVVVHA